jgi:hypothetical protein
MQSTGQSTKPSSRRSIVGILRLLMLGVLSFLWFLGDSHSQIRGSDIIKLIATGFCWAMLLTELLGLIGPKWRK